MPGSAASSHRSRRTGDNRISVEAVYGKAMQSTERARRFIRPRPDYFDRPTDAIVGLMPRETTRETHSRLFELRKAGATIDALAERFGLGRRTIQQKLLREMRREQPRSRTGQESRDHR
jgi:hypothetical protein